MSSHLARLEALLFVAGEDGLSLRTMAQLFGKIASDRSDSVLGKTCKPSMRQMRIQLFIYWNRQIPISW